MSKRIKKNILIVGAGFTGLCLGYFLKKHHSDWNIVFLEKLSALRSDKTWSFHKSDLEDCEYSFIHSLISNEWDHYFVHFDFMRKMNVSYCTIKSEDFFEKIDDQLIDSIIFNVEAKFVCKDKVISKDNKVFIADLVFDTRDIDPMILKKEENRWGYQKFFGLEIATKQPHNLSAPILMDSRCSQIDGYRFMYLLPYSDKKLLIEDTYYSNSSGLSFENSKMSILKYAKDFYGIEEYEVMREEFGSIPIPLQSVFGQLNTDLNEKGVLKIGSGAGFCHPVTGYSVCWAIKIIYQIIQLSDLNQEIISKILRDHSREFKKKESFYLLLNKLMFQGATSKNRINIFRRFYTFPENLIRRFYGARSTNLDKLRLLVGTPPIPVKNAIKALMSSSFAVEDELNES